MKKLILLIICSVIHLPIYAQSVSSLDERILTEWHAGASISEQSVREYGERNCFQILPIDSSIFERIKGLSYKDNCSVPLSDLRYLKVLHYNAYDQITLGEIVCSKLISEDLISIFRSLYRAKYPIESILLVDEYGADDTLSMENNNSSAFNFRYISGTTRLSNHSLGLAIDINPLYNPYVREVDGVVHIEPTKSAKYVDRSSDFKYKIDATDLCYKLFISHGFTWGGDWTSLKDYQHFEKTL